MATFYPSFQDIQKLKRTPEAGELRLLNVLRELPDQYEVFFQPFLNGDRPDVIVLRKDYGVLVIEVKDYSLNNYYRDDRGRWRLKKDDTIIRSPIDQVYTYKKNLFELHIGRFIEKQVFDAKFWHIVKCMLYLAASNKEEVDQLTNELYKNQKRKGFLLKNIIIQDRNIYAKRLLSIFESIKKVSMGRFTDEEYNELTRFLKPTEFDYEQFFADGGSLTYTTQQKKLIISEPREQWIKGVVGSGKTTVLAARAKNAYDRVTRPILILTYNITLKNYIHDKISRARGKFDKEKFFVIHYDQFISCQMNEYEIPYDLPANFDELTSEAKNAFFSKYHDNSELFEKVKDKIDRYSVILIDEVQDFKKVWLDIVKKYFLASGGEYVLFSDEKQNIYNRSVNNKDITTNIAQRPTNISQSVRSGTLLRETFLDYQESYLSKKYDVDDRTQFMAKQGWMDFGNEKIRYGNVPSSSLTELLTTVEETIVKLREHPKSVAIISESIRFLRDFDLYYRLRTNETTNPMFGSLEVHWGAIVGAILSDLRDTDDIKKLREIVRKGYRFFTGNVTTHQLNEKLCTLISRVDIERVIDRTRDKRYLSNAEHKDPLLKEPEVREWIESFLNDYSNFELKLEPRDPFLRTVDRRSRAVEDSKKNNFWFHSDGIKISTIQSFKGWEASTIFLVIPQGFRSSKEAVHELIYTSITRAKRNLVILNLENRDFELAFENFFLKHTN